MHSTIGSNIHARPLNSLEHCIYTTSMTNIGPVWYFVSAINEYGSDGHIAWRFVIAAACRAVLNSNWCMFFREILPPLSTLRHCFDVVSLCTALYTRMLHLMEV